MTWSKEYRSAYNKDKEIELLPILQKLEGLTSDTKLLIKKLKQMENSIKELKKEILEE